MKLKNNEEAVYIAKQFVLAKLEGQKQVLRKYGLRNYDLSIVEKVKNLKAEDMEKLGTKLMSIEATTQKNTSLKYSA
jgi:CRISPR/Cas system-associated endonuclease Cas1